MVAMSNSPADLENSLGIDSVSPLLQCYDQSVINGRAHVTP